MIVLIDNYDSFTYNLVQYFGDLGQNVEVYRNDKISVDDVMARAPKAVVFSPGPGDPDDAGICLDLTQKCAESNLPLFGVCLGLQTIGQAFGGKIIRAASPMHGKVSEITHDGKSVFDGLPSPFNATRYHSLIVEEQTLPGGLEITARTDDGEIMGLAHTSHPIHSVQFHPESIATEHGHAMLETFLKVI